MGKANFHMTIDLNKLPPPLDRETNTQLARKMRQGDKKARQQFIEGNMRLVLMVLSKIRKQNMNADDLFQAGCLALCKCADRYDPERGISFTTYATNNIYGEIRRYCKTCGENETATITRAGQDNMYKMYMAENALKAEGIERPTLAQIAERSGIPELEIRSILAAMDKTIYLEKPISTTSESAKQPLLKDMIKDPKQNVELYALLHVAIENLSNNHKRIIRLRYFEDYTQNEIAEIIGLSQAQISRLETAALKELKKKLG